MCFAPTLSFLLFSTPCLAQVVIGSMSSAGFYGSLGSQTNNPVSMVFEHKQSQALADGTHISTVTHEYFYRDSLGRTRSESEIGAPWMTNDTPMRSVFVQDPVAGTYTNWQVGGPDGTAHQFTRNEQHPPQRLLTTTVPDTNQSHTVVPTTRPQQTSPRPRPKTTTEQLGVQDVQGIPCEATRMTVVYPTDFLGNDRPITTVTERCQSREFGRVLRDSTEDPRSGVRSTTLQSVTRGEPDPSIFLPPADYTDAKSQMR